MFCFLSVFLFLASFMLSVKHHCIAVVASAPQAVFKLFFLLRLMFASSEKHRQHYYKKYLKISKNPKFESCTLDTVENTATTTSIEQYRPFYVRQYHSSRMGEFNITFNMLLQKK